MSDVVKMFICYKCGNIDNIFTTKQETVGGLECWRCKHGDWHGYFEERKFDPQWDEPLQFLNPPQLT